MFMLHVLSALLEWICALLLLLLLLLFFIKNDPNVTLCMCCFQPIHAMLFHVKMEVCAPISAPIPTSTSVTVLILEAILVPTVKYVSQNNYRIYSYSLKYKMFWVENRLYCPRLD